MMCNSFYFTQVPFMTDITEAKGNYLLQVVPKWADSDKSLENSVAKLALDSNLSTSSKCHASFCYLFAHIK